ncbi:MAG: glycogen debranching enzyme N-terminal domain-containing protein, partial [Candidatus Omnitrophica bacterium]|nr:glycogen debranching enzyme N-terminal domain-containing protein [Candidatus Omnitrophota bacterium]
FTANCRPLRNRAGFEFVPAADRHLRVFSDTGFYHHQVEWCYQIPYPVEQSRGMTASGDACSPGWFELPLPSGGSATLTASADPADPDPVWVKDFLPRRTRSNELALQRAGLHLNDAFGRQLVLAIQAYVARRNGGKTVVAGYPWFLDWGRDSLICARGMLAAGMTDDIKQLLVTFGRFEQDGTLPNSIHGENASNRDTSDAPLWFGLAVEEAAALMGPDLYLTPVDPSGRTLADVLRRIAAGYCRGTFNGVRVDPGSGLVWSPSHFTWMDTNFPAGTPREGYPVEIQALWIRLLRQLDRLEAGAAGKDFCIQGTQMTEGTQGTSGESWRTLADRAELNLEKFFWLEDQGYLADVLEARPGVSAAVAPPDRAVRSNCLLAVSLGLVSGEKAQRCVETAQRYLAVPGALRSLAPLKVWTPHPIRGNDGRLLNDPGFPYWGRYEGDEDTRRKPAYHNGTAWTWTFAVFCEALAKAWNFSTEATAAAKAYLRSLEPLLVSGCLGHLPEILDGDAPHTQRGCDAQAWSATEALRVWKLLSA